MGNLGKIIYPRAVLVPAYFIFLTSVVIGGIYLGGGLTARPHTWPALLVCLTIASCVVSICGSLRKVSDGVGLVTHAWLAIAAVVVYTYWAVHDNLNGGGVSDYLLWVCLWLCQLFLTWQYMELWRNRAVWAHQVL
ncbi:hypothetical protein DFJ77DRAFT_466157 [Powellomyces hirtus]|nr:hypothetical protein DFJ77DRAFT_466157 [Powellomyces hirtus]